MSLFTRLFSPNKRVSPASSDLSSFREIRPFSQYNKNDVRVILFRECDWRGRKLLFDSLTVEKIPLDSKTPLTRPRRNSNDMVVEITKGFGYKYKRPLGDTNALGEAIFGSIAMATKGPSFKVHVLKDPSRIMLTKIIQAPRSGVRRRQASDEKNLDDSQGSSMNSMGDNYNSGSFSSRQGSFEATVDDSGFGGGRDSSSMLSSDWFKGLSPLHSSCSSHCPLHLPSLRNFDTLEPNNEASSASLQSNNSLSSLRRRWARSVATSLDLIDNPVTPSPGKRTKLGIALILPLTPECTLEMEKFVMERLKLMNNIVTRLQHSTEQAYSRRDAFVHTMLQATANAQQSVFELLCGFRMAKPMWLHMTSDSTDSKTRSELSKQLVQDLGYLLTTLDTKHTNFFVSTLLTAVLTHHLGWVPTVLDDANHHSSSMLADLSRSHPYNPLWAQLSDLQGALGYPQKIAMTVLVGKSELLLQKLLSVFSYFIRCGQTSEADLIREQLTDEENCLYQLMENKQDSTVFDKEAIREFSKATSFQVSGSSSCSTLTKSRTLLSMKNFNVNDGEVDNTNSLESGFESCNDCLGDSFDDGSKLSKPLKRVENSHSCVHLLETSFMGGKEFKLESSDNVIDSSQFCYDKPTSLSVVNIIENQENVSKIESEKQYTSAKFLNIVNKINSSSSLKNSGSKSSLFIRENILQCEITEPKESKVVFVLGENEELVNIKGHNEVYLEESLVSATEGQIKIKTQKPIILIDKGDTEDNLTVEDSKTENKTDFISGDVNNRVLIVRSTPIEIEGMSNSKSLKPNPLHRCLSVPEEAVSETDWVRSKRSREAIQLVQRWLSDSAIENTHHKPFCETSDISVEVSEPKVLEVNSLTPASVFRTSNRTLEHTKHDSYKCLEVQNSQFEVPTVEVEDVDTSQCLPADEYCRLPPQRCVEDVAWKEVGVAASMFGAVSDVFCPDLVLQAVRSSASSTQWHSQLRQALSVQAHSASSDTDFAEAVCIVANTDTWEVEVVSSHSVAVGDHQTTVRGGIRVGMSQLVANIMETCQQLCSLSATPQLCLSHVEAKLLEMCVRSQALAELLLNSDFLDMTTLTSTLDLDPNDVPLLLSVASAHTPLVTRKYGLSFQ